MTEGQFEQYIDDITPWQWVLHERNLQSNTSIVARLPTMREAHGMLEDLSGKPTPIIRGGLKIDFSKNQNIARFDQSFYDKMPALELNVGPWGDTQNNAHKIAQDIATMAKSQIQIPSLTIFSARILKLVRHISSSCLVAVI